MSNKIVIDVDYKEIKKAQRGVEDLEESVKSAKHTINKFGKQKAVIEISADNSRFIAALKKTDHYTKDFQISQLKILDSFNSTANKTINSISAKMKGFSQGNYHASVNLAVGSAFKNVNTLEEKLNGLSQGNWSVRVSTGTSMPAVNSKLDKPAAGAAEKFERRGEKKGKAQGSSAMTDGSAVAPTAENKPEAPKKTFKQKFTKVKDDFFKDPLGTLQSGISKVEEKFGQVEDIANKFGEIKGHYNNVKGILKPKDGKNNDSSPSEQTAAPADESSSGSSGGSKILGKFKSIQNMFGSAKNFFSEGKKLFSSGKKDGSEEGSSGGFADKLENFKNMAGDVKNFVKEAKNVFKSSSDGKDGSVLGKIKGTAGKAFESIKSSKVAGKVTERFGDIKSGLKGGGTFSKIKGAAGKAMESVKSGKLADFGRSAISKLPKATSALSETVGKRALFGGLVGKVGSGALSIGKKALTTGSQIFSKLGVAGSAGAAMTAVGVVDGAKDIYKGLKADNKYDKKYETTKGAATMTSTLTGAAIGTAILPGIGTFLGSGIGYLFGKFGGKKVAEKVAGGSEEALKYADRSENAAKKVAEESTPVVQKFDEKLATIQNDDERKEAISGFVDKMGETTEALTTLAQKNLEEGKEVPEEILNYLNAMSTYQSMLNGEQGNVNPQTGQLPGATSPATCNQSETTIANGDGAKGTEGLTAPIQLVLNGEKEIKDKIEVSAKDFGIKSSVNATVQVNIDVIPQVTTHVTGGGQKKGNRKKKFRGGIVGGGFPGFAEGGYVRGGAQLITVAEEGTPEAIIPLGKHRRKRAMELFSQVGSYLQAPGFSPKGFAAGGIVGGSIGGGFGGGMPAVVEVGGVEIKVEAKDGQNLVETIRENKEAISEEIAGVFNAAFKGQFANTPASGGVSA